MYYLARVLSNFPTRKKICMNVHGPPSGDRLASSMQLPADLRFAIPVSTKKADSRLVLRVKETSYERLIRWTKAENVFLQPTRITGKKSRGPIAGDPAKRRFDSARRDIRTRNSRKIQINPRNVVSRDAAFEIGMWKVAGNSITQVH